MKYLTLMILYDTSRSISSMGIAWELSIHGCIQLGLKIDMLGNRVGSPMSEPQSDSFDQIREIPNVRF